MTFFFFFCSCEAKRLNEALFSVYDVRSRVPGEPRPQLSRKNDLEIRGQDDLRRGMMLQLPPRPAPSLPPLWTRPVCPDTRQSALPSPLACFPGSRWALWCWRGHDILPISLKKTTTVEVKTLLQMLRRFHTAVQCLGPLRVLVLITVINICVHMSMTDKHHTK